MAKGRWNTWVDRHHSPPDPIEQEPRLVEPGESLPTHMLVERMMNAGVALSVEKAMARIYEFGAGDEIPDGYIGAMGRYSNDIVDVDGLRKWLEARLRGEAEEAERLAAEAALKKEEDAKSKSESGASSDVPEVQEEPNPTP